MPRYHPRFLCPITGVQDPVACCRLILKPEDDEKVDPILTARKEWVWGLDRGGLDYFLPSAHNALYFRPDIARLYFSYEFALVPTFKTYVEAAKFIDRHAGVFNRGKDDVSPRRPLTALASPSGRYRYVFIPFSDAARRLQDEFPMQPQTEDDLNGWENPLDYGRICSESGQFPIVECYAHPYCVMDFAAETLSHHRDSLTYTIEQWQTLIGFLRLRWTSSCARVPRWFIDAPLRESDDLTIDGSEASGYLNATDPNSLMLTQGIIRDRTPLEGPAFAHARAKVMGWFSETRQPRKVRRQQRVQDRSPYARTSASSRRRKHPPIAQQKLPAPKEPPKWVQRNGLFPTQEFSSSDWAYFHFGASLDGRYTDPAAAG
ncbi:hypothetical protein EV714DRAFT_209256 [Schizophyllum commune]